MIKVSESLFKKILKRKFSSLVGKSCKRLEVLRDKKEISTEVKIDLIKDLIKELNYETMRDIEEAVLSYKSLDVKIIKS
ncbi:MAG: hypothetical protein ACTSWG_10420 [Candidatus Helarchaeota archaeon]